MPNIKPFRDINESFVINLYAYESGAPLDKGTFVKISPGLGFDNLADPVGMSAAVGNSYAGTVSQRYAVPARFTIAQSGDLPLGMMLYDVKEEDENGEKLIFNPRKQAEMQCLLSGQAVPLLTKGLVLYSGALGTPTPGALAYSAAAGVISPTGTSTHVVGKFVGKKDAKGWVLLNVDL